MEKAAFREDLFQFFSPVEDEAESTALCVAAQHEKAAVPRDVVIRDVDSRQELRKRLKACLDKPMESAGMFVFDTCRDFVRTVPVLPRDERNPDDIDDESEDHIADEVRYRVMHRRATIKVGKITGF
jgi:hypothetical protein